MITKGKEVKKRKTVAINLPVRWKWNEGDEWRNVHQRYPKAGAHMEENRTEIVLAIGLLTFKRTYLESDCMGEGWNVTSGQTGALV